MRVAALLVLVALACRAPGEVTVTSVTETGPRVLCVFAHPDDETTVAATLYKTATFLDGAVDILLITNGEGGFKYSTLAERIYGQELTEEGIGRAHLPRIRREEFLAGCALMGVRRAIFLGETDHRYSQDPLEVLGEEARVWDVEGIRAELVRRLPDYDFVLTMAPSPTTHGHHQAATVLTVQAAAAVPEGERPVVLGVRVEGSAGAPPRPVALAGFPETAVRADPALVFDRTQPFGHRDRLDYRVVVNWVIAEHKSQGTMQLAMSQGVREHYFLFEGNPPGARAKAAKWFEDLAAPQFPVKTYGESAGTNAGATR